MAAVPIEDLYKNDLSERDKREIQRKIKERIPTGFNQHRSTLYGTKHVLDDISNAHPTSMYLEEQLHLPRVTNQLGTLGGGNHFLEVVHEEKEGQVWIMLHSGSRNIGNRVATHYDRVAKTRLEKQNVNVKQLKGLNYMPIESNEGQDYLKDMMWCQQYAFHNRRTMKDIMIGVLEEVTGKTPDMNKAVNIHHNYCACVDCGGGRKLWVTR